ncbi:MAG: hypothetical protein ACR65R_11025 [Methylomicrobium sp.]
MLLDLRNAVKLENPKWLKPLSHDRHIERFGDSATGGILSFIETRLAGLEAGVKQCSIFCGENKANQMAILN